MRFTIELDNLPEPLSGILRPVSALRVYTEEEAADILRLKPHTLKATRQRGEISFSRIVKKRVRYTQDDLNEYLQRRHIPATANTKDV
jgi:hypothetical protein